MASEAAQRCPSSARSLEDEFEPIFVVPLLPDLYEAGSANNAQ